MDKFFKISERGSNVKLEIIGGLTTFFAMAYIILVNPNQVAAEGANGWLVGLGADPVAMGQIWNSVYIASILVAIFGTLLMALYARLPFAQACGMGLNSFFCTCFVSNAFFGGGDVIKGYQAGLVIILLSGVIFLLLSVSGLRTHIARALPDALKKAIPGGIGLFIAFIGFKNASIVVDNQYTFVQFFNFNAVINKIGVDGFTGADALKEMAPPIVAIIGLIIIAILTLKKVKGSVIIGILAATVIYYLMTWTVPSFDMSQIGQSFKDFASVGLGGAFSGEAWKEAFNADYIGGVFSAVILIITFCIVDMFDTIGTLYGTASEAGMLDENGDPIDVNKAMASDSLATVAGAIFGTSTCTTFVESASGVAAGARTGLASLVTSACFVVCLFLSPFANIIPSAATAPALIFVGVLMLKNFANVDMKDMRSAVPAFLTLVMMPLTYSISNGIGIGAISYVLITLFTGKYKKNDIVVTIIALLFVFKFIFGAI